MTETRSQKQIAREALKEAKRRGVIRDFAVRDGGRATVYPAEGREGYPNKFYTQHSLDTLALLTRLGFDPNADG